ncbi:TIGR02594 family protein [Geomonas agri]|uniref:TIGR02594 family protein n=1 Tax=Geomonas agri TaxID=2873702 RepID=UPI001CD4D720|nr:TIGR02594 family protein [Geomonas agri]
MNSGNQQSALQHTPWMGIARKEIGQKEVAGHRDNPRILSYHATTTLKATDDETPWCSSFVNWCLKQAGVKGTDSAAATSWVE